MAELRGLVVSTLHDVRRLAVELRPAALDDFGLVPAIERLRDIVEEQGEISVDIQSELSDDRLPANAETALYRIAQEAFTNVLKHAGAARVTLRLSRRDDTVTLSSTTTAKASTRQTSERAASVCWACRSVSPC